MRRSLAAGAVVAIGLLLGSAPSRAAAQTPGALAHYQLDDPPAWRFELPVELAEISGVAFTAAGLLLGHGDERAAIWQIDIAQRKPVARFGFTGGGRLLHGDFEDIQVVDGRVFLVTSSGELFEGREVGDGRATEAVRRSLGLSGACEVEGLAWDAATTSLLLLCKRVRSRQWKDRVVILAISARTWRFEEKPRMTIPVQELERATGAKRFNGTAMTRHPQTGNFLLLAGPQRAYAEVDESGKVLGGGRLDPDRHPQPEGIGIAPDSTLVISDEAAGRHASAISGYAYR